jgi:hypothetical protein
MYPCETCRTLSEALQQATKRLVEATLKMARKAGTGTISMPKLSNSMPQVSMSGSRNRDIEASDGIVITSRRPGSSLLRAARRTGLRPMLSPRAPGRGERSRSAHF